MCILMDTTCITSVIKVDMKLLYLLWQEVNTQWVFAGVGPQLNLGKDLVGERVAHHKARMAHGTAQVHQTPLGQNDDMTTIFHAKTVNLYKRAES